MSSITLTSRYQRNLLGTVLSDTGIPRQAILHRFPQAQTLQVVSHLWTLYDRIDLLAYRYFNNETFWWMIAEANPRILDWTNIPIGSVIRIPSGP